ncbi:branched-chain amino acid transport system substrate-binding protein [Bradyrhizobium sp. USDA 4503]
MSARGSRVRAGPRAAKRSTPRVQTERTLTVCRAATGLTYSHVLFVGGVLMLVRLKHALVIAAAVGLVHADAAELPGVTATEIKIGATFPFSGPASQFGAYGKGVIAYINALNDRGGINGRKINLVALDDAYSPPKAVEHTRRLVEGEEVAVIFSPLGTATNSAIVRYLNSNKIPHLFVVSGAAKFTHAREFPYTTTSQPSYATEGKVIARFIATSLPEARIGVLYQNDDLGRDFLGAFKDALGAAFDKQVVAAQFEVTQPTIESQILTLKAAGANALFVAGAPKFAAQAIRKAHELNWKPLIAVPSVASSVSATLVPAGLEASVGVISSSFYKDPNDPKWTDDPAIRSYRTHFAKYLAGADMGDTLYLAGTQQAELLEQVLRQCGDDLSRENINRQAHNIRDFALPTFLDGVRVNTSPTVNQAITQIKLRRWSGRAWEEFGELLGVSGAD